MKDTIDLYFRNVIKNLDTNYEMRFATKLQTPIFANGTELAFVLKRQIVLLF